MIFAVLGLALLGACSPAPEGVDFHDPHETRNRFVHEVNKDIDRAFIRPAGKAYGTVLPKPIRTGVSHFAENLSLPNRALNQILQFDIPGAVTTSLRFATNTIFGVGGLYDPATEFGLPNVDTDFGATLHKWGAAEGTYVELPLLGPSTERDAVGVLADFILLDPLGLVLEADTVVVRRSAKVLDLLGTRHDFSDVVDDLYYNSEDSYIVVRSAYLQRRRFELDGGTNDDDLEDPYDDF